MNSPFDRLFDPQSIAVVGSSNTPGKQGYQIIRRLAASFAGRLIPIHPHEKEIAGIPVHARLPDVAGQIDLLVALIPGERLVPLVESCPPGKVGFLAAIPSGFAELSPAGRQQQNELVRLAHDRGMRVLGPNIVGLFNGVSRLNASLMPSLPRGGPGLSCLTQSGGFGMALSMYALDRNLPVAKFCDLGNMADVQVHDIIRYFADDPDSRVIGLFLESVQNHDEAMAALSAAATKKPVIITPVGIHAAGRRASVAHLGLSNDAVKFAAAAPKEVVRADTALDLLNAANALLRQPRAKGRRTAIVTGTGGIGAEVADLCSAGGLGVVEFSQQLKQRLRSLLPGYAGVGNPVDLTPIWQDYPSVYPQVLDTITRAGEADIVIICITDVPTQHPDLANALAAWTRKVPEQTRVVFWGARDQDCAGMAVLESAGLPCYRSTRETAAAAAALSV